MAETEYSGVTFINDTERAYFEEARLGIEVQNFLQSETGRYLHGRAKLALEEVKVKMVELNSSLPTFAEEFNKLQQEASHAQHFMAWCAEAIVNGRNAEQQLEEFRG